MTDRYDVMTGTPYTMKDGTEKTRWTKVGAMFPDDNGGFSISLEALPMQQLYKGKLTCRLICRVPRDLPAREERGAGRGDLDDSVPF
jgi:hypothetical protein